MNYIKLFENFDSFGGLFEQLMDYIIAADFAPISAEQFDELCEEGWVEQIEDFYNDEVSEYDFSFIELDIPQEDRDGLMSFNDDTVSKYNMFDIRLKRDQKYPFNLLDTIDYDSGRIFIFKHMR